MRYILNKKSEIIDEIIKLSNESSEIFIAVSFITSVGINPLINSFKNKKIKIITTTDEYITNPDALQKFIDNNWEVRILNRNEVGKGFHTKFIIFKGNKNLQLNGSFNITWTAINQKFEMINIDDSNSLDEHFNYL